MTEETILAFQARYEAHKRKLRAPLESRLERSNLALRLAIAKLALERRRNKAIIRALSDLRDECRKGRKATRSDTAIGKEWASIIALKRASEVDPSCAP